MTLMNISENDLSNKPGILIRNDKGEEFVFTEAEAEGLRIFLNNREVTLRDRILFNLNEDGVTLRDLSNRLGVFIGDVNEELMRLEAEKLISLGGKMIDHWDLGPVQIPLYKTKIPGTDNNVFREPTE